MCCDRRVGNTLRSRERLRRRSRRRRRQGPDALLKDKIKQKRHREGYEEGVSVMHRPASAASFVAAERPVEALGRFTRCGASTHQQSHGLDLAVLCAVA